jgi:hypothetical protein
MTHTTHYVIEGVDRLGKDTLIKNLINLRGFHHLIHYSKPQRCAFYERSHSDMSKLEEYQREAYFSGFELISRVPDVPIIFNRFHLGEVVYSSKYRGYSGEYVYGLEREYFVGEMNHLKLVLLKTSDWSIISDDGDSHDFSRRREEQEDFEKAFWKSHIKHKVMIDVARWEGGWKSPEEIAVEAIAMVTVF